jgi:hypothetical protein
MSKRGLAAIASAETKILCANSSVTRRSSLICSRADVVLMRSVVHMKMLQAVGKLCTKQQHLVVYPLNGFVQMQNRA